MEARETYQRMTLSRVVEMLLGRDTSSPSYVTLSRAASGETLIEVNVRATETETAEDAAAKASLIYEKLRDEYPATPDDRASVSLTRNAKGETQIEVTQRTGTRLPNVADVTDAVIVEYDRARSRYPMLSGFTAAPGSVSTGKVE